MTIRNINNHRLNLHMRRMDWPAPMFAFEELDNSDIFHLHQRNFEIKYNRTNFQVNFISDSEADIEAYIVISDISVCHIRNFELLPRRGRNLLCELSGC